MNTTLSVSEQFSNIRFVIRTIGLFLFLPILLSITAGSALAIRGGGNTAPVITLKGVLPPSFAANTPASVQFTVANPSIQGHLGQTAVNVILKASLPTPYGLVWTLGVPSNGCSLSSNLAGTLAQLTCSLGNLASDAAVTVAVNTTPANALNCGSLFFSASVVSIEGASASFTGNSVATCPALAVTKTADAASVALGNPIGFTIGVANQATASSPANNVTLTDSPLPATGAGWSITSDSSNSCSINVFDAPGGI